MEVNPDAIHATINAAQAQCQGRTAWINSFSVPEDLPQCPEKSPDKMIQQSVLLCDGN